jgi:hypothetical protein
MVNAPSRNRASRSLNLETFALILREETDPESIMRTVHHVSRLLTAAFFLGAATSALAADDGAWTVSKSSGEVWLTSTGAQPASLKQEELLKPGDTIRTGRTGRVLLKRGEESMMVSPNSVIGVPSEKKEGLSTTIVQQAGSVLLEVEKRNVKHFEVETPYLAAVVKGTQFRVTVNATSTSVDVIRGQVEVADFRTGQIAQVKPGQHATTFSHGNGGLSLSGSGTLSPIEQGKPRTPSVERVPVPRAGLTAPRGTAVGQAVQPSGHGPRASLDKASQRHSGTVTARAGVTRISSSIGEIRLNVHKVTNGLARDKSLAHGGTRSAANKDTIWSSSGSASIAGTGQGYSGNVAASSAAVGTSTSAAATVTSTVAVVTGSGTNSSNDNNGNGNSNKGATGNGRGNNGNGNGNGGGDGSGNNKHTDNGNNGNGNGSGGNGHGKNK